jgi:phosphoglycolate phosphatase-like HAD superfamily hydrolase
MQNEFKLIIFDLDGTLAEMNSHDLYPDARAWIEAHPEPQWHVATNQGGVGLRYWMECEGFGDPSEYPTQEAIEQRLMTLFPSDMPNRPVVHVCFRYQSKKSGKWCPAPYAVDQQEPGTEYGAWNKRWRKPAPGMLENAMYLTGRDPVEVLMVGDGDEDQQAAYNAGCHFQWAWEFFNRPKPTAE